MLVSNVPKTKRSEPQLSKVGSNIPPHWLQRFLAAGAGALALWTVGAGGASRSRLSRDDTCANTAYHTVLPLGLLLGMLVVNRRVA